MAEYFYAPTRRSLRVNAGPEGYVSMHPEDRRGPFGTIKYSRPLTKNEIEWWELATIEIPRVVYNVHGIKENGEREFLLEWRGPIPGDYYGAAERRAEELKKEAEFVDYVIEPA